MPSRVRSRRFFFLKPISWFSVEMSYWVVNRESQRGFRSFLNAKLLADLRLVVQDAIVSIVKRANVHQTGVYW